MAGIRIAGLAKLISTMVLLCNIIGKFAPGIRNFVPEGSLTAYDNALTNITTACDVLRAIEYADGLANTNAPWGS